MRNFLTVELQGAVLEACGMVWGRGGSAAQCREAMEYAAWNSEVIQEAMSEVVDHEGVDDDGYAAAAPRYPWVLFSRNGIDDPRLPMEVVGFIDGVVEGLSAGVGIGSAER